jgi:hypothetical protein
MVITALIEEGAKNVKDSSVRRALPERFGLDPNAADDRLRESKLQFMVYGDGSGETSS